MGREVEKCGYESRELSARPNEWDLKGLLNILKWQRRSIPDF